jgi:hypothetical protein
MPSTESLGNRSSWELMRETNTTLTYGFTVMFLPLLPPCFYQGNLLS